MFSLLLLLPVAHALPFRLASIFGNGMVLQRNAPVTIWGFGEPSAPVFATLTNLATNATFNASGATSAGGAWSVSLPPQAGGYQWRLSVSDSPEAADCAQYPFYCEGAFAEISGVVFGDVLLCIGQSNMQVNVGFVFNASQELNASASFWGLMKVFQVQAAASSTVSPLGDFAVPPQQPWSPAGPTSLPEFSATCYFSAKSLILSRPAADRDVVLGLVAAPWGGTPIRAHAPLAVNQSCGPLYPASRAEQGCGMYHAPCAPGAIYNAMLAPLSGAGALAAPAFPVAAFIWCA
jgi:sialate O-acetylesterase